ncbi:von Willebrand factor A domain-containing protein 7-like [Haliotis cracherodii]|uniref:von Willebrand factor A domain-containing protein 7-like n=1 Tax=Haliotis cracherodii TaxID=6455 RepID=UPI0039EA2D02
MASSGFSFVVLLVCVVCVLGFLPNRYSLLPSDFTHQDITEAAILRAVAKFCQETLPMGIFGRRGDFGGIKNVTAKELFEEYCGGTVSEKRFQEAIDDIVKANNRVDQDHYTEAAWHVNGEAIKEAHEKMMLLREASVNELYKPTPDYAVARDLIGQFLHIVQMFYSNTNWPEMNGSAAYDVLGIRGKTLMDQSPISMDTCRSCNPFTDAPCTGNLLIDGHLTSGYRSGQDRRKPERKPSLHQTGKCSHGGPLDMSSTTSAATGGINKDSSDPNMSPHYYLHHQAAEGAIRHTTAFFIHPAFGLRHLIGDEKFQELLQLQRSSSLGFVIHTGDSMCIATARETVTRFMSATKVHRYIVVSQDESGSTDVTTSRDGRHVLEYLNTLEVNTSRPCHELTLTALETAASVMDQGSKIYVLTSVNPGDLDRLGHVSTLLTRKKLTLEFVLTRSCVYTRRNIGPPRARRSAGLDLYAGLAAASGGSVYSTDKAGVGKMSDVIKESVTTSGATILKMSVGTATGKLIDIPIDNTIREVTIKIIAEAGTGTGTGKPTNTLTDPHKAPIPMKTTGNVTLKDLGGGVRFIKIKSPQPGVWHLTKQDSVHWALEVTAQSTIDFSTKFVQTNPLNGFQYEITGRPIAGDIATAIITVPSIDKIGGITQVVLIDSTGTPVESSPLTQGRGRAATIFKGTFTLPTKTFQVSIHGTDKLGNALQRLDPMKISPLAVKLHIGTLAGSLYIKEDLKIPFTVTNTGDSRTTIDVDITDDQGFAVSPLKKSFTLAGNSSATGTFTLHAGSTVGVTTTVTVSAQPVGSASHSPQFDTRRVTVEKHIIRKVDNTTPECNVTSVTGSCSMAQMDPCSCHLHTWSGTAQFGDVGFGLFQISSTVGTTGTFTYDNFTLGHTIDKGAKTASIGSDCCDPVSYINVVDMASNTAQCTFDLAPGLTKPAYDCTTTTTTTTTTSTTLAPSTTTTVGTHRMSSVPSGDTGVHMKVSSKDHTPPVCNVTSTHGRCSPSQTSSDDCDQHVWFGTVQFGDEGSGLYLVKSTAGDSSVLNYEKFAEGDTTADGLKTASLTATCCHPLTYVIVIDVAGNEGQCEFDVAEAASPQTDNVLTPGTIAGISVGVLAVLIGAVTVAVLVTKYCQCSSYPSTKTGRFRTTAWD